MLQDSELQELLNLFEGRPVALFVTGSQIDGATTDGSDIDLVAVDSACQAIQYQSLGANGRRLDLTIFPATRLDALANPQPKPDDLPLTMTECAVLNAIGHGRRLSALSDKDPTATFCFDRAARVMAESQLYLAGAAVGTLKRRLRQADRWLVLFAVRQIVDCWSDGWLATHSIFIGKGKWRLRYLHRRWPEVYVNYLAIQFPGTFNPLSEAPVAFVLERLVDYLKSTSFESTPLNGRASQITDEVSNVFQRFGY